VRDLSKRTKKKKGKKENEEIEKGEDIFFVIDSIMESRRFR
jgi:hypothetical protein